MDLHCWSIYLGSLTECRSWLERIPHNLHWVHPCATNSTKSKVEKYKLPVFWPPWFVVWRNSLFLKYLFINTKSPFWNLLRDLWWCRYLEAHQQRGQKCDNRGGIGKSVRMTRKSVTASNYKTRHALPHENLSKVHDDWPAANIWSKYSNHTSLLERLNMQNTDRAIMAPLVLVMLSGWIICSES